MTFSIWVSHRHCKPSVSKTGLLPFPQTCSICICLPRGHSTFVLLGRSDPGLRSAFPLCRRSCWLCLQTTCRVHPHFSPLWLLPGLDWSTASCSTLASLCCFHTENQNKASQTYSKDSPFHSAKATAPVRSYIVWPLIPIGPHLLPPSPTFTAPQPHWARTLLGPVHWLFLACRSIFPQTAWGQLRFRLEVFVQLLSQ